MPSDAGLPPTNRRLVILIALGLCALTAIIYAPVTQYGFITYDDNYYIYDNLQVKAGGFTREGVHYAFTTSTGGNWNPLLWFSFYADRALLGLKPGLMHIENVVLHAVAGVLILLLLVETTGAVWRSAVVAALFLCHPMHVESVVWVTERKDVLSTPLLLAAMLAYVRFVRATKPNRRALWYAAMLVFFVLSLMVKAMGVTLPALLLLLDFWPLRRRWTARLFVEKLPLVFAVVAIFGVALRAQQSVGATTELLTLSQRMGNAIVAYIIYAMKLIAPTGLAVFYPHPGTRPGAQVFAASMLLLLISAVAVVARRGQPYLFIGWFWFIGTLVPVIGIVQVGSQAMADRYSYLPSIGIFIAMVWLGNEAVGSVVRSGDARRWLLTSMSVVVVAIASFLCRRQLGYWRDSQTLFVHAIDVTGDNWVADMHLGDAAFQREQYAVALEYFEDVMRLRPLDARAYFNAANCFRAADPLRAIPLYRKAIELDPRAPAYHVNLAAVLLMTGDRDRALAEAREALRLQPDFAPAQEAVLDIERTNSGGR